MNTSLQLLLAFLAASDCHTASAATGSFPSGYKEISAESAIGVKPIELFPGFALFQRLDRWANATTTSDAFIASLILITCDKKAYIANLGSSYKSFDDAIRDQNETTPTEPIKSTPLTEIDSDKRISSIAQGACNLRATASDSSIEIPISSTSDEVTYVVARTIGRKADSRTAWLHSLPTKEEPVTTADGRTLPVAGGKVLTRSILDSSKPSFKNRIEVNCKAKTMRTLESIKYAANGSILFSSKAETMSGPASSWVPGSIGETISIFLCR